MSLKKEHLLTLGMALLSMPIFWSDCIKVEAETSTSPTAAKAVKPSMIQTSQPTKPLVYNPKTLHRLDFRVVGKSCAVCLMNIQHKVKEINGVVKAAVMLRRPYGAVVLYDASKVGKEVLLKTAKSTDKEVKIEQVTDYLIAKPPIILIPLYGIPINGIPKNAGNSQAIKDISPKAD